MTLDQYGHRFADQLDEAAERPDAAARAAHVYPLRTGAEAVPLAARAPNG